MPFVFSEDSLQIASEMARTHVERYYRTMSYNMQDFISRTSNLDLRVKNEYTRTELRNRQTEGVIDSGIYLIVSENEETVYVGLANNFYTRFNQGYTSHNDDCEDECAHYGHFVNPTLGSRSVGMPDGDCRYFILESIEHEGFGISQAEIDWYFLFIANGWRSRNSRENKRLTNDPSRLGMKGGELSPCIVVSISSGEHTYFLGQNDAGVLLNMTQPGSKVLGPTIAQNKNQQNGYTARHATNEEIEAGEVVSERDVIWRDGEEGEIINLLESCQGCLDDQQPHSRRYRLFWNGGFLSTAEIAHLNGTRRNMDGEGYNSENPQSDYRGVRWHSTRSGWQCGVRTGPQSNDFSQRGPHRAWNSDDDAALYRERWILAEGYQEFNSGRLTGSNANLLNERLSLEQRSGQVFVDWSES